MLAVLLTGTRVGGNGVGRRLQPLGHLSCSVCLKVGIAPPTSRSRREPPHTRHLGAAGAIDQPRD